MKLDLQVRDLQKGDRSLKTFESVEEAKAWLAERPKFTEVLGVASHQVPREVSNELRDCCRPLDQEEKLLVDQLDKALEDLARERAEQRRKKELEEAQRHRAEMADADPNRPMEVRYCFNAEMALTDPADTREITDVAREAVMAWVAERNEWVESRNQVVGDAKVQVWPGPIPEGKGDKRIVMGTFIPVTAPKKD